MTAEQAIWLRRARALQILLERERHNGAEPAILEALRAALQQARRMAGLGDSDILVTIS